MLFIVADEPDETLEAQEGEGASLDTATARKAQLDDAETSKVTQKVDLDLDDAPFLEEDEDEEELLEEEQFELPSDAASPKEKKSPLDLLRNKFVLGGAAVAVLIVGVIFFLLTGDDAPDTVAKQPIAQPVETPEETIEEVADPGQMLVKLDPFIIEQRDATGALRFLEISLVFSTTDPNIAQNLTRETHTVRYALFYYMKNKDLSFLTDQENVDNLKKELLSVTNQYMVAGEFETLLFEQYLVK